MKFNLKLIPFFLIVVFLYSCNAEIKEKEKVSEATNALKTLLPKQDSTLQGGNPRQILPVDR